MLVVVMIVGILFYAGSRMGAGQRGREIQIAESCVSDLRVVFNAENRYRIEKGRYLSADDAAEMNKNLGMSIQNTYFDYRIQSGPRDFKVVATRKGGSLCGGKRMSITQTGEIAKECPAWR